jgi:hypothetical protein
MNADCVAYLVALVAFLLLPLRGRGFAELFLTFAKRISKK